MCDAFYGDGFGIVIDATNGDLINFAFGANCMDSHCFIALQRWTIAKTS